MKQIKEFLLTCLILSLQYNTHWAWKMSMVSQFPSPGLKTVSSLPFQSIECNRLLQHRRQQRLILGLRGGSDEEDTEDEDTEESDHDDDNDGLEDSEDETDKDSSISNLDESQQKDDNNNNNNNNNNEDNEEMENDERKTSISSSPIKITLKTAVTNNPLIEQSIEITASPTRTVHSLKQSVSRQFKSKPPIESIQLRLDGQLLDDDETLVEDLIVEDDEDDDDEEEDDDHDGMPKLNIVVDMIPPVDPKFGTEMKDRLDHVTNEQLLEAYVVNLAAMHQNSIDVMAQTMESNPSAENDTVDEENMEEEQEETVTSEPDLPVNLALQKYATMMKSQIIHSLSDGEKKLLEKTDTPSSPISQDDLDTYNTGDLLLKESIKRKKRRGGATINMKRVIQKNLNIVSRFFF